MGARGGRRAAQGPLCISGSTAAEPVSLGSHMGKHVGHCLYESGPSCSRIHETFVPLPRRVFDRRYPLETLTFGQRLRKLRMDAGIQIRELARAASLHEMTIINWEQGRSRPSRRSWERVRRVMEGSGGRREGGPWPSPHGVVVREPESSSQD